MDYRHATPPMNILIHDHDHALYPGGSASTTATSACFPNDWSPVTAMTAPATPPTSPPRLPYDACNQWLLPEQRVKDKPMGYSGYNPGIRSSAGHMRTFSCPEDFYQSSFEGQLGGPLLPAPVFEHRSLSPPDCREYFPAHVTKTTLGPVRPQLDFTRPWSTVGSRAVSASAIGAHSRSTSNSSLDAAQILRLGYPHRAGPIAHPVDMRMPRMPRVPSALSHLSPVVPGSQIQSYPKVRRTSCPPAKRARLSHTPEDTAPVEVATSSVLDYLTAANPTPSLVHRLTEPGPGQNVHFWFDVRNVKPWADFNVATMTAIPSLLDLLNCPIPTTELPFPVRLSQTPETLQQLAEICAQHHAVKVNAALRIAQGEEKHMTIRTLARQPAGRQQPEFVANYQSLSEKVMMGNGNGRVVGIVKSFEQWSSALRSGTPNDVVNYRRHLAHLHRFMREHGTRYGFIMTEIELVCVRAGGPPMPDGIPLFGHLEVAAAVQVSAAGRDEGGGLKMTVGLALWYLHMLAKEEPFPGQYHWKMAVGAPEDLTRQRHRPLDDKLPKPSTAEKREAKRVRGWVWPDEPRSKRETAKRPRARARKSDKKGC